MWLAPVQSVLWDSRVGEFDGSMLDWQEFVGGTKNAYGVDMSVFTEAFHEEQQKYFLRVSIREPRLEANSRLIDGSRVPGTQLVT